MKRLLLILTAFFFLSFVKGQTNIYHPFPDSNAVWTVQARGCCTSDCPPPPSPNPVLDDYSFSYFLESDTMINGYTCNKIYQSGFVHSYCMTGNYINNWWPIFKTYIGAYRQDVQLKKVFFIYPSSSQECLLYDFGLDIGDTLMGGCLEGEIIISSIDSVLIGNEYRNRFLLSNSTYTIIEGVGSTAGLFEPFFPFEYSGTLNCFVHNGHTLYPDTITTCEIVTHANEVKSVRSILISPNPFNNQTSIQTIQVLNNATLTVYNSLGQQVKQIKNISGQKITLNRDNLPSGIYFIHATQNDKTISMDKLIITDK
jgi:hypothetical protein